MKIISNLILLILLAVFCVSCGEGTYISEKKFFHAQHKLLKLEQAIKAGEKIDNEKADSLIMAFKEITIRYPYGKQTMQSYFNIAFLYQLKGENDKAVKGYLKICEEFPQKLENCANAIRFAAEIREKSNDWEKAEVLYQKLKNEYPYTVAGILVPLYLAQKYHHLGLPDKSVAAAETAVAWYKDVILNHAAEPTSVVAINLLFDSYRILGQKNEFVEFFEQIMKRYPDSKIELLALNKLIAFYYVQPDKQERVTYYFNQMKQKFPKSEITKGITELLSKKE